jgi:hypothetical protein
MFHKSYSDHHEFISMISSNVASAFGRGMPLRTALLLLGAAALLPLPGNAQQPPAPSQLPAPQPAPVQQPQYQQSAEWAKLPKMQLERQFSGPLQDTVIQRLRDPVDGTVCYLYLPISVQHSPTTATGFVQYGPNGTGSISCVPGMPVGSAPAAGQKR